MLPKRGVLLSFSLLGITITSLPGCHLGLRKTSVAHEDSFPAQVENNRPEDTTPSSKEALRPFELEIASAFVQDEKLNVKVMLAAKQRFDTQHVVLSVAGLRDGVTVEEQVKPLAEVFAESEMNAGQTIAVFFTLEAADLSEYQVRCSWGRDADEVIARTTPSAPEKPAEKSSTPHRERTGAVDPARIAAPELPQGTPSLALRELRVMEAPVSCEQPPCDLRYTVNGQLENSHRYPVYGVKLAVGLFWVSDGQSVPPPLSERLEPSEELVSLSELTVAPSSKKRIRVNIDRAVPVLSGGQFLPRLRVLQYSVSRETEPIR